MAQSPPSTVDESWSREYEQWRSNVVDQLESGHARQAFALFRPAVEYPAHPPSGQFADSMRLLARIAKEIAGPAFANQIERVAASPDDPTVLYQVAYQLYEEKLYAIAATLLSRANKLLPGQRQIVTELCSNLEALAMNAEATEVIRAAGNIRRDPMCQYLLAFNSLMAGDLNEPRVLLPSLEQIDDPNISYMARAIRGMLERSEAIKQATTLDQDDLAGWHVAINASILLYVSPYGFAEGMHGRFAHVADSYDLVRQGLGRLKAILEEAAPTIDRIYAAPDRSSQIMACAASKVLGMPWHAWPEGGTSQPGLVVAYDLDQVGNSEFIEHQREHHPRQLLWAHASSWTDPFPYAPDITTFLHQACAAPWSGEGVSIDPDTGTATQREPDNAPAEELGAKIAAIEPAEDNILSERVSLRTVAAIHSVIGDSAAGVFRSDGARCRQRTGSPVPSTRVT